MTRFSGKRDRRYWRNLARFAGLALALAALGLYFGVPLWQTGQALHPPRFPIGSISPADLGLDYQEVALSTEDGLKLRGWYLPSANRAAVILVHASSGNRTGTIYHAALLAEHGYGALLYDTRAQGESEGDLYALGWQDHLDILAAVDYLQRRPEVEAGRIGVLGLSAGAKAALYAASQSDRIAAVVAEGTRWRTFEDMLLELEPDWVVWVPAEWLSFQYARLASGILNPTPLRQAVAGMPATPLLLIAARGEMGTGRAYTDAAGGPKTLWARDVPGHHIDALFAEPKEYERRVIGFFDQALLERE